jgi:hypothetical protein
MPESVITRTWSARAPLARVVEATRLDLTPQLHPLVTRVSSFEECGARSACVLHERVPFGPLHLPNTYRAARELVEVDASYARIALAATAAYGVQLRHELALRQTGGRTDVAHVVRIRAPFLVRRFVARTAERAHDGWVARVVEWAESASPPPPP